jgi:hypothetical protein
VKSHSSLIALATCEQFSDLAPDDQVLIPALSERGIQARPEIWDNRAAMWAQYDLVVVRSTWDYAKRRPEFLTWTGQIWRLHNPAHAIEWNSDKHYLIDLQNAGVDIVPTTWMEPEQRLGAQRLHTRFPASGDFVIKPAVSGGSKDSGRYTSNDAFSRSLAIKHTLRLLSSGRTVMLQRYVNSVDATGETGLIYIDGEFSHAVQKGAKLTGPDTGDSGVYRPELVSPTTATDIQLEAGRKAIDTAAAHLNLKPTDLLYARADFLEDDEGAPMLLELELIDPVMFFGHDASAVDRFADAIVRRIRR